MISCHRSHHQASIITLQIMGCFDRLHGSSNSTPIKNTMKKCWFCIWHWTVALLLVWLAVDSPRGIRAFSATATMTRRSTVGRGCVTCHHHRHHHHPEEPNPEHEDEPPFSSTTVAAWSRRQVVGKSLQLAMATTAMPRAVHADKDESILTAESNWPL